MYRKKGQAFANISAFHISLEKGKGGKALINYNFASMQNRFRCTSVHMEDCVYKRADVHITYNNMMQQ